MRVPPESSSANMASWGHCFKPDEAEFAKGEVPPFGSCPAAADLLRHRPSGKERQATNASSVAPRTRFYCPSG